MLKIGQVYTAKQRTLTERLTWFNESYVWLGENRYTYAALVEYWTLIEDVCEWCKVVLPVDEIQNVSIHNERWDLCPDCYHDGPPEPQTRAHTARGV